MFHKLNEQALTTDYAQVYALGEEESRHLVFGFVVTVNSTQTELRVVKDGETIAQFDLGDDASLFSAENVLGLGVSGKTFRVVFPEPLHFNTSFVIEMRKTGNGNKSLERGVVVHAQR